MSGCVVCTSLLRGDIDGALLVKRQAMDNGHAGESFDTIAARLEQHRLQWYPDAPRITANDIQIHYEAKHSIHPYLPVVLGFPLTPKANTDQPPTQIDKIRQALEGIVGIGLYNLRAMPEKVTPDALLRALRMLLEIEQKDGKRSPLVEELTRVLEARTIPGDSPLGKASRPILEEEELAPLPTDAVASG